MPKDNLSRFQTIKRNILENKEAKTFLESLGIKEPDEIAEIKTFICPNYLEFPDGHIPEEEYSKDLDYVYQIWDNTTPQKREEIINNLLKDSYFIGCFDNKKRFTLRKKENEDDYDYYSNEPKSIVYFESKELISWFEGNTEDYYFFVTQETGNKYEDFLKKFGIKSSIYLDNLKPDQSRKYYGSYRKRVDGFSYRFKIHGLQHSLNHINLSRSLQIWSVLLERTEKLKGKMEYKYTKNPEEAWRYDENEQLSLTMELLTKHYWLFDNEERLIELPLADISLVDLHQDYDFKHPKFDKLVKILELKSSDEIKLKKIEEKCDQLEKENAEKDKVIADKNKMIEDLKRETSEERLDLERQVIELTHQLTKLSQPNNEVDIVSDAEEEWVPEVLPDELPISVNEFVSELTEPRIFVSVELPNPILQENNDRRISQATQVSNHSARYSSRSQHSQDIGYWGEQSAYQYLKQMYDSQGFTVIYLNSDGNRGEGCDFKILRNNQVIAYYEIKSKVDETPTAVTITRAQWALATSLYKEERGDEYVILVVSNAGKHNARIEKIINNPIQKWKNGELEAQPIEIIL